MALGNELFKLRKKYNLSQEQLGERVGVTRQTISNWELSLTIPDAKQLIALSQVLQISIDELVGNNIQNLLEKKVSIVENNLETNNKLLKIIVILSVLIIVMIIIFISLK